ncbi:hypothetical protein [Streptomyces chromofuscus]|uniref:hypothetical protein n=1 Tax=Streptomyces chromofuscus TaxID=42881 RepID=UPI001679C82F|nr:hypothetical protein [Streptomyces chromofuscus]GGT41259.1 hypothetical protein GCM10010254_71310 [Streptomyces chromofuscus]
MTDRRPGKLFKLGAALTLSLGALTAVTASPATADDSPTTQGCTKYFSYGQTQVQIDNCPGNGAASWAWIYRPADGAVDSAKVELTLANNTYPQLYTTPGYSNSASYGSDIVRIAICERSKSTSYWSCGSYGV